jgi:hypothetical protein
MPAGVAEARAVEVGFAGNVTLGAALAVARGGIELGNTSPEQWQRPATTTLASPLVLSAAKSEPTPRTLALTMKPPRNVAPALSIGRVFHTSATFGKGLANRAIGGSRKAKVRLGDL